MDVFELEGRVAEPVDPDNFTGDGTLIRMPRVSAAPPINAYHVTFEPGARTAWHSHTGTQLLIVVRGRCRFQKDGGSVSEAGVGEIVSIEPGEVHWHGAAAETATTHVAINVDAETNWLRKVSDAEYSGTSHA